MLYKAFGLYSKVQNQTLTHGKRPAAVGGPRVLAVLLAGAGPNPPEKSQPPSVGVLRLSGSFLLPEDPSANRMRTLGFKMGRYHYDLGQVLRPSTPYLSHTNANLNS